MADHSGNPNGSPIPHKDDHGDHGDPSAHHASGAVDETPVSNSSIVGWGLAIAVLFFGSSAVLTSVFTRIATDEIDSSLTYRSELLDKLHEQERTSLTTYGYVGKDKKLVHIPIEEGIKQVIAEAQTQAKGGAPETKPEAVKVEAPKVEVAPTAEPTK